MRDEFDSSKSTFYGIKINKNDFESCAETGYTMLERERGQQEPDMVTWMMQFACAMNRSAPLQKVWRFRLQKELHSESTLGEQTLRPVVVDFLDFEIVIQFWEAKSMRGTCPRFSFRTL